MSVWASRYATSKRPICPPSSTSGRRPGARLDFAIDFESRRSWLVERLRAHRAAGGTIVVGLGADGRPAGFVTLDPANGYLDQLCVAPRMRGSGPRAASARCGETPRPGRRRARRQQGQHSRPAVLRTGGFSGGDAGRERALRAADAQNALDGGRLTERAAGCHRRRSPLGQNSAKADAAAPGGENAARIQGENNHAQLRHPVALGCRPRGARDACPGPGHQHRSRRADDRPVWRRSATR